MRFRYSDFNIILKALDDSEQLNGSAHKGLKQIYSTRQRVYDVQASQSLAKRVKISKIPKNPARKR